MPKCFLTLGGRDEAEVNTLRAKLTSFFPALKPVNPSLASSTDSTLKSVWPRLETFETELPELPSPHMLVPMAVEEAAPGTKVQPDFGRLITGPAGNSYFYILSMGP